MVAKYQQLKIGMIQFPGSNCDWDLIDAYQRHFGITVQVIWHQETDLPKLDGLLIPGGFSFGDFLRSGCLAAHSNIMASVKTYAKKGGAILGICNGFQVLTESHLLPGALIQNDCGTFVCRGLSLSPCEGDSGYHKLISDKDSLSIPVAHADGRYVIFGDERKKLLDQGQVLFSYEDNPNGSVDSIAGVVSENGRIVGMMPHPERATDLLMGSSEDGRIILKAFLESCF